MIDFFNKRIKPILSHALLYGIGYAAATNVEANMGLMYAFLLGLISAVYLVIIHMIVSWFFPNK